MNGHPQFQLKSGELLICQAPRLIVTVLGSCVAVTMFNAHFRLAAICHAMLPKPRHNHDLAEAAAEQFKYLVHAIPAMCKAFHRAGIAPDEIEVKMFGGGNVIDFGGEEGLDEGIGATNIRTARELLSQHGLRIIASNVGGFRGRKLIFDTATGEVFHKYLSAARKRASKKSTHLSSHAA